MVKLTAEDGQVGWGESITQFPEASWATKAIIEGFAPLIIGKDPVQTETHWRAMKNQAWWYGYNGGIASYAESAIDIPLWDLKGKTLQPRALIIIDSTLPNTLPPLTHNAS